MQVSCNIEKLIIIQLFSWPLEPFYGSFLTDSKLATIAIGKNTNQSDLSNN